MNTKSERFEMRSDQGTLARIDRWRSSCPDKPSRAEALRRLIDTALIEVSTGKNLRFSDRGAFNSEHALSIAKRPKGQRGYRF